MGPCYSLHVVGKLQLEGWFLDSCFKGDQAVDCVIVLHEGLLEVFLLSRVTCFGV